MVDNEMFKTVYGFLGGFEGNDLGDTGLIMVADRLTLFLNALPELAAKAWSYGAIKPLTALIVRDRNLEDPAVLHDETLRAAICFLAAMGRPWQDHLLNAGTENEAKKATGKLYRWMMKEGIVDGVVKIWCAFPKFSTTEKRESHYEQLSYKCASVLWFATAVHIEKPELATRAAVCAELLKPILHYLLEEQGAFNGTRQMALCLLIHLWLSLSVDYTKLPEAAKIRKGIAQHKDTVKLVALLQDCLDHPAKAAQLATLPMVQGAYMGLLRLLSSETPGSLTPPVLQTACRLLGTITDPPLWSHVPTLITTLYRSGKLTPDDLLAHAFPGFLRLFAAEVARRLPATSFSPELRWIGAMFSFLSYAFGEVLASIAVDQGRPGEEGLLTGGAALSPETLPRLVRVMIATGAAGALAALSGSTFYVRTNLICSAVGKSVMDDVSVLRPLLDQMVPPIVLSMFEDSEGDRARCMERAVLLRCLTRSLRGDCPGLHFAPLLRPKSAARRLEAAELVNYNYDLTLVAVDTELLKGKEHVLGRDFGNVDGDSHEMRKSRLVKDLEKERWFPMCSVCKKEVTALKRCARCRVVEYCGATCQAQDWPTHKKVCKGKGDKKGT